MSTSTSLLKIISPLCSQPANQSLNKKDILMTPRQIELVQESWAKVEPIADQAARLFYRRLFELAPEVRPLFTTSVAEQGEKLMKTLAVAVTSLNKLETIIPVVEELGRRHNDYGALPEHYDTVAEALLWTLEQGLGKAFTDEVREAWTETYTILAGVMIRASTLALEEPKPAPADAKA
jgi:hemoglobin-like flavoprotein